MSVIKPSILFNCVIEATSLAVQEAIACLTPVIGFAIGGISDIIQDESCGLLVEAGDPKAISKATETAMKWNINPRSKLTQNEYRRLEKKYSIKIWEDKLFNVKQELSTAHKNELLHES